MTAFSLGAISAILDMDTSSYTGGILNAQALNSAFGQSFTNFITNPVLGGISAFRNIAGSAISFGQEILANAEDVQRLSDQTGILAETLQALRAEFDLAGSGAEVADAGIRSLDVRMGEAKAGAEELILVFRQLGVDVRNIESTDAAFRIVLQNLAEMEDRSQANAIAVKLFSEEAGPKLLQVVGPALDDIIERQRRVGQVFSRNDIDRLADFNTTLGTTQQALDGIARTSIVSFLSGFISETGTAQGEVVNLAGNINDRLAPALRDLGSEVGQIVGDMGELVDRLNEILDLYDRIADNTRGYTRNFSQGVSALDDDDFVGFGNLFTGIGYTLGLNDGSVPDLPAFTPQEIAPTPPPQPNVSGSRIFQIFNELLFGESSAGTRVP